MHVQFEKGRTVSVTHNEQLIRRVSLADLIDKTTITGKLNTPLWLNKGVGISAMVSGKAFK